MRGFDLRAAACYSENEVRFRRMRYLTFLLAAMFFASNAIAAARAYIVQPTGQEHAAVRAHDAEGDAHPCQQSDDASCVA